MYLIEQKSIYYQKSKKDKYKQNKNVNKCGRWTVQNRAVVALNRRQYEKKKFFKKLKVEEIKCRIT